MTVMTESSPCSVSGRRGSISGTGSRISVATAAGRGRSSRPTVPGTHRRSPGRVPTVRHAGGEPRDGFPVPRRDAPPARMFRGFQGGEPSRTRRITGEVTERRSSVTHLSRPSGHGRPLLTHFRINEYVGRWPRHELG